MSARCTVTDAIELWHFLQWQKRSRCLYTQENGKSGDGRVTKGWSCYGIYVDPWQPLTPKRWPLRREGRVRWAVVSNEVLSLQDRLPAGACQQRHELDERKITIPLKFTYSSRHAEPVCLDNPNKHDADRGPTLSHHWFNVSCLMGRSAFWMISFDNVFYQGI